MNQTEQQEFMKQMDMADERLRNAGVRIEIVKDFAIFFRKKIEELWVDDLHKKHNIKEINLPGQI